MSTNLIEYRPEPGVRHDDIPGLQERLAELVGEPFRFARVSYGDELTLHFGDLRHARSPKLRNQPYGAYILGLRGSLWRLKSGVQPIMLWSGPVPLVESRPVVGRLLTNEEVEKGQFIEPGSRVLMAEPFPVRPSEGVGLQIKTSDGSSLVVLPSTQEADVEEEKDLPALTDWNLLSARGLVEVGPGFRWSFEPHRPSSNEPR